MSKPISQAAQDFPRFWKPMLQYWEQKCINATVDSPFFAELDDREQKRIVNKLADIDKRLTRFADDYNQILEDIKKATT